MTSAPPAWQDATLALTLMAVDPAGLGGFWLKARSGPVRDRWISALPLALSPRTTRRLHPAISDDQLFGGLDLAATLEAGQTVMTEGVLNGAAANLVLTMAERCPSSLAAKLAIALDHGFHCAVLLDEGCEEERAPEVLTDRVAFHIDLGDLSHRDCPEIVLDHDRIEIARLALPKVFLDPGLIADVTRVALRLGITSLRAPSFALRAARALAAIQRTDHVDESHLSQALTLVYGPRATQIPQDMPEEATAAQDNVNDAERESKQPQSRDLPEELLLQAVAANLPKDLLDRVDLTKARQAAQGSGSGAAKKGNRRGRPKPSQKGQLGSGAQIDLIATLRAAAPWQTIRKTALHAPDRRLQVRASDIRLKRFEEKSDRLLIFAVDASGSAALARLAEAKGAVELLLAEAYARRDHVALIAFRGAGTDLLLPPTRSLVQTKKRLSALPGGGGTPLAAGLEAALQMAEKTRGKGLTPTIVVLTDGRANIALDGSANRSAASEDAKQIARMIRARQTPALVIDTGNRPQKALSDLALDLAAPYLPLPRADAHRVSQAIEAVLD
ncbi:protoporphyrin IX magnesium-chelatase [Litoreibacter ponti]|uniref:Protoporphyrin IX magnesium-chelatase n=1 Tax=Litoreibacter ponti TaxID=1510457 RepID=A0A2T6BPG4_9RHOB|nr:magnesium chelatase subunit D [Litoreibacter ponti]PTX57946.1 protoporphyrin IX magnesium-chelatase [Litoreibacter ponti]